MPGLPRPLLDHLAERARSERDAAWFLVDPAGLVREVGGNLSAHGMEGVVPGAIATDVVSFLQGTIEERREHGMLPMLATAPDRFADVHLLPVDRGTWVLLLDATGEAQAAAQGQQQRYDLILALEELHKRDFAEVVKALEVLVLREGRGDRYYVVGVAPEWARPWLQGTNSLELAETWPFLESFLPQAQAFCSSKGHGVLRSGSWMEMSSTGEEVPLEAVAVKTERRGCLILVEFRGEGHREHQQLIQRAREHHLAHGQLLKEVDKKEVLLHCIVHDLNGPLTAMMGCLDLLTAEPGAPRSVRSLGEMGLRQARRQERMIRNILEVYAADLGALEEEAATETVDPVGLVKELAEEYEPVFRKKGIHFALEVEPDCPRTRGEIARLARVLANLLDNALRHTSREAHAAVRLALEDDCVAICVENEGDPVPEELRARLFDRFTRSPESGGAAGLGLFFCQITVERWGGSITYEPMAEGGSRFRIRLPLALAG